MLWRVRAVATLDRFCCLLDLKATLHFRDSEGCEVNEGEKGGRGEERGEKRRRKKTRRNTFNGGTERKRRVGARATLGRVERTRGRVTWHTMLSSYAEFQLDDVCCLGVRCVGFPNSFLILDSVAHIQLDRTNTWLIVQCPALPAWLRFQAWADKLDHETGLRTK